MLRQLNLFNVAQCDGLPAHMQPDDGTGQPGEDYAVVSPERLADVQTMLEATGVEMEPRFQDRAYYTPVMDRIVMPLTSQFDSEADYLVHTVTRNGTQYRAP